MKFVEVIIKECERMTDIMKTEVAIKDDKRGYSKFTCAIRCYLCGINFNQFKRKKVLAMIMLMECL